MFRDLRVLSAIILVLGFFLVSQFQKSAYAGQIASVQITVSPNLPTKNANYNFNFKPTTTAPYKNLTIRFCTTDYGTCVVPIGMNTQSAQISSSNIGIGYSGNSLGVGQSGSTNGVLNIYIPYPSSQQYPNSQISFTNIINPATFGTFYARITTYGPVSDQGTGSFIILQPTTPTPTPTKAPVFTPVCPIRYYAPCDPISATY